MVSTAAVIDRRSVIMFLRPPGARHRATRSGSYLRTCRWPVHRSQRLTRRWAAVGGGGGPLFAVDQVLHTLIGATVDPAGIPPDKVSFGHAVAAVTDTVTAAFPSSRV